MIFCNQCGTQNSINAKFCSACGAKLSVPADQGSSPSPKMGVFKEGLSTEIEKKSFGSTIYHRLFIETDPREIWKAYLPLMIFNLILSMALSHFEFWAPDPEMETYIVNIVIAILGVVVYVLVKPLAIDKQQKLWMLPVLLLFIFAFFVMVTEGEMDYSPAVLNVINNGPGIKSALYLQAIGWWDFAIGVVLEFFLLIRIFLNIKKTK